MRKRSAVRVLIVSPEKQILLARMRYKNTDDLWLTPGGGIDSDEDHISALHRELNEEIYEREWPAGPAVWVREHRFMFEGEDLCQKETYYLLNCTKFEPPSAMPDAHENQYFLGYRWWSLEDLTASKELFVPRKISHFLIDLVDGLVPDSPIDVGI